MSATPEQATPVREPSDEEIALIAQINANSSLGDSEEEGGRAFDVQLRIVRDYVSTQTATLQSRLDAAEKGLQELVDADQELNRWSDPECPGRNYEEVQAAKARLTHAWAAASTTVDDLKRAREGDANPTPYS